MNDTTMFRFQSDVVFEEALEVGIELDGINWGLCLPSKLLLDRCEEPLWEEEGWHPVRFGIFSHPSGHEFNPLDKVIKP